MVLQFYFIAAAAFWVITAIYILGNSHKIPFLRAQTVLDVVPPLAIIIAVRNEEADLEKALKSVCTINYPNYRIILLNDRSTDQTALIAERYAKAYEHLVVKHITDLPPGWLGKNHALYNGYLVSDEEWILFTDADIIFKPDALRKAMSYVLKKDLDHLTVFPEVESRSPILNSLFDSFKILLLLKARPWEMENPRSKATIGIGAFNLISRKAYEKAGTHVDIRLRPDDDLKLAERIRKAGLKQGILNGNGEVGLEWYSNVREFINGLMKNTYAVLNYNPYMAILSAIAGLLFIALPLPLLLAFGSGNELLFIAIIIIAQIFLFFMEPTFKARWWYILMIPFAGLLMSYIVLRSMTLTIWQGGIYWRDSFYSLKDLKSNK